MTGRRLYDLLCDEWSKRGVYDRDRGKVMRCQEPVAWPFLSHAERTTFSRIAARIKGVRR